MRTGAKYFQWVAGVALAGACLALAMRDVEMDQAFELLPMLNWAWLPPLIGCGLVQLGLRAWRWRRILSPVLEVSFAGAFNAYAIGNISNFLTPFRAGDLLRVLVVSRQREVSRSAVLATVVSERVLDAIAILLLLALTLVLVALPTWMNLSGWGLALGVGVVVTVIAVLKKYEGAVSGLAQTLDAWLPVGLRGRVSAVVTAFLTGFARPSGAGGYYGLALETAGIWILSGLSIYIMFLFTGINAVRHLGPDAVLVVMVFSTVGVSVPLSLGYIGTLHLAVILALGLYGVPNAMAFSFAVGYHLICLSVALCLGIWGFWFEQIRLACLKDQR